MVISQSELSENQHRARDKREYEIHGWVGWVSLQHTVTDGKKSSGNQSQISEIISWYVLNAHSTPEYDFRKHRIAEQNLMETVNKSNAASAFCEGRLNLSNFK